MFYQGVILADGSLRTDYFPAEATANGTLPAMSCYFSESALGPYYAIATEYSTPSSCVIVRDGTGSYAVMIGQQPGFFGSFVIVY